MKEIREIREHIPDDMEIRTFYSWSNVYFLFRKMPAQQLSGWKRCESGGHAHITCRWKYSIVEEKRHSEYMPVFENERGTYIFNSKDLCMVEHMDDILNSGIDSLKIEGRMKTALYVATVARTLSQGN